MTHTPERLDGDDVVNEHWPYDGPHSPDSVREATVALSALVRYCKNATTHSDGLGYAPQVYTTLGGLTETAERLPQLMSQLFRWAKLTETDATVRHDQHRADADRGAAAGQHAASEAAELLHSASLQVGALADTLSRVRAELAHLCHDLPDE